MGEVSQVVLGIAGNSPGYLNQTGENRALNESEDIRKPRALFPMYVADGQTGYLADFPFSSHRLQLPASADARVQMEPELALKLKVQYHTSGAVECLNPIGLSLINDATYRNKPIDKLAQKKNWGPACKGLDNKWLSISEFNIDSDLRHLRLCGFLKRVGSWQQCSQDVSVMDYHLFFKPLLGWITERINSQQDEGALHDIKALLQHSNHPDEITVAIGAPCYTKAGETHHLRPGDQTLAMAYDHRKVSLADIEQALALEDFASLKDSGLCLHQRVVA